MTVKKNRSNSPGGARKFWEKTVRLYDMAFATSQKAFLKHVKKKKDPRGEGIWVYYESYADFKRARQKARIIGWGTMLLCSAVVVVVVTVNFLFPAIFRSEASIGLVWRLDSANLLAGEASENIYIDTCQNEIGLKASAEKRTEYARFDLLDWITPAEESLSPATVSGLSGGQITVNQGYAYTPGSKPGLPDRHVSHSWLDENSGLLYVSSWGGLTVIDTKKTVKPDDDFQVAEYSANSKPALGSNYAYHSWADAATRLLYISTWGGLAVIDTLGTASQADDQLIVNYSTNSSPALSYNKVRKSILDKDSGYLFVATDGGGLDVIDTKKTASAGDDEKIFNFSKNSQPSLGHDRVSDIFLDPRGRKLYVGTWGGGARVIENVFTDKSSFPTSVNLFNIGGKLPSEKVYQIQTDQAGNVYVGTIGGLAVFDQAGKLVGEYSTLGRKFLRHDSASSFYVDERSGRLYVGTAGGGVSVIDTGDTADSEDDNLLFYYSRQTDPSISDDYVNHLNVDSFGNIYISTENNGLSVLTPGVFNSRGVLDSPPIDTLSVPAQGLSWTGTEIGSGTIAWQYRTSGDSVAWQENWSEGNLPEIEGLWGGGFETIRVVDGRLELSGRDPAKAGASFRVLQDSGRGSIPAGSIIRMKIKALTADASFSGTMFTGDWQGDETFFSGANEWKSLALHTSADFSGVGFSLNWNQNIWKSDSKILIDDFSIEFPSGRWSEWKNSCAREYLPLETDARWLQLKAVLSASSPTDRPAIENIALLNGYSESGTYISPIADIGKTVLWNDVFVANSESFSQAGISVRTKADNSDWSEWFSLNDANEVGASARYLQIKVLFNGSEKVGKKIQDMRIGYSFLD